uniref:Rab3 GTPase-activating protein catalytic subunit n=1 Tax=Opuntia streptacantha TaxID=393608 RepID=A0A7C9DLH1_OPUST
MGTAFTRRFDSDCIRSQVPVKLMHLEGLYELFVSKFAYSTVDFPMHLFRVQFTMKLTYRTLPYDEDDDAMPATEDKNTESAEVVRADCHHRSRWDDDCPWSEWYSADDPVKGFELITVWSERTVKSSLEMAEIENSTPHEADAWLLLPILEILKGNHKAKAVGFASQLPLLVDALEKSFEVQFLEDFVSVESNAGNLKSSASIPPPTVVDRVRKELFHEGAEVVNIYEGEHKSSRAIKGAPHRSLFAQFVIHSLWLGNCNICAIAMLWIEFVREVRWSWEESQPLPKLPAKGAIDLSSCLIHQKLEMLALCIENKCEANAEFYDATSNEDELSGQNEADFSRRSCHRINLNKETQMLGYSGIRREGNKVTRGVRRIPLDILKRTLTCGSIDGVVVSKLNNCKGGDHHGPYYDTGEKGKDSNALEVAADRIRRGSAGVVGSMMLLNSCQRMHAPFTKDAPPMTEDMHEMRLHVSAFGNLSSSAQLERDILLSDMSAFKAANPDAVFEDFIRWHSRGDWESNVGEDSGALGSGKHDDWPPNGRLSKRMSEHGNFWRKLWNDAPALPAYDQKPLFNPNLEGEKILHYLETLPPHQLLEQMVCTAFRASADTLSQTSFGDLNQMKTKLDQLYLTMASMLRPLQANQLSQDSEIFEDLKRLCVIFEHVERLTILAASLHQKFILAPRLAREIFTDYYNFYLPKMGQNAQNVEVHEEFERMQRVRVDETGVVADLFMFPSANQSWRKVLSMGNLLNGHEPAVREIIFTMHDDVRGNHYAAALGPRLGSDSYSAEEIETYRMYIRGTSNDLAVTLSVVSCD